MPGLGASHSSGWKRRINFMSSPCLSDIRTAKLLLSTRLKAPRSAQSEILALRETRIWSQSWYLSRLVCFYRSCFHSRVTWQPSSRKCLDERIGRALWVNLARRKRWPFSLYP